MAQRAIREYHAKKLLAENLEKYSEGEFTYPGKFVLVDSKTDLEKLKAEHSWLATSKLVVKPDQLIGKRGKHKLLLLNASFNEATGFIKERLGKEVSVGKVTDKLTHFIVEEYIPHKEEYYVAIKSNREGDTIYFSLTGGIEIEELWEKVVEIHLPIDTNLEKFELASKLPPDTPPDKKPKFEKLIKSLFKYYADSGHAFLELNPFVIEDKKIYPLDLKARLDDAAHWECRHKWAGIEFPAPFGRKLSAEEASIKELDEHSGASLKLTILNPKGRIWTMIAGGGASIIYTDTIVDLGYGKELANYGEYSGNPTTDETYQYAKTILDLMTREPDPRGKVFIIGGGIANFTDVAKTFTGIIKALREYKEKLIANKVKIYVRRGGPNYQEGLANMRELAKLGIPIAGVYGPEAHMTSVVPMGINDLEKGDETG